MTQTREHLASRLGFLLLSAGCAIGLGNVWRFPYITGEYGGGLFVLMYAVCLLFLGMPLLIMEFSVGRASQLNMGAAFKFLTPQKTVWHRMGIISLIGSYLLMMFYTTVCGWMLYYSYAMITGQLALPPQEMGAFFGELLANPNKNVSYLLLTFIIGLGVCIMGIRKGIEPVVKLMMAGLLILLIALAIRAVTLPNATAGLEFYLMPNLEALKEAGFWEALNAAMGQSFFTLGLGVGSMTILGSYIGKERSLTGEAYNIMLLDSFVALMAGIIIFPACFAFNVEANSGPGLVFITLPNVFNNMIAGQFWGSLFFILMSFAALSTVIAVFENIISYGIDVWGWSRKKSTFIHGICLFICSLPCALGFNVLSHITPLGPNTTFLDLWDFLLSNNILPAGALIFSLYCSHKIGWGMDNFLAESNAGIGAKFPKFLIGFAKYILPILIFTIFIQGYLAKM